MIKKLCSPNSKESLFACKVYFNCDHQDTGTQVINTYYSYDTTEERAHFIGSGRRLGDYNGFRYLMKFLNRLCDEGKLWYAMILNNQAPLDKDGMKPLIHEVIPSEQPVKRFTDPRPSDYTHNEKSESEFATAAA